MEGNYLVLPVAGCWQNWPTVCSNRVGRVQHRQQACLLKAMCEDKARQTIKSSNLTGVLVKCFRLTFSNFRYLWRPHDTRLLIKGRISTSAVRSVFLYGLETKPLRADVWRFSEFEHRCPRSIVRIWWEDFSSGFKVRHWVVDPRIQFLEKILNRNRLS